MKVRLATLTIAAALTLGGAAAQGQGLLDPGPAATPQVERTEYAGTAGKLTPSETHQAKAQIKAAERSGRIANRAWYGYSPSRPKTTATPFSGMYGAQFQGYAFGRPSAHYATRPILVLTR